MFFYIIMTCKCVKKSEDKQGNCNASCGPKKGKPCNDDKDCSNKTNKNTFSINEFNKITNKYKIKYSQSGGSDKSNMISEDGLKWSNKDSFESYKKLVKKIGLPDKKCIRSDGLTEYVIWQNPYDKVNPGSYGGLDFLKLTNHHAKKWHPYPADVFIIAGRYMIVPDHLLGPIKFASETINVEQLFVEKESNEKFGKEGIKGKVLVTGSCASIDISTVTVAFVEDMISKNINNKKINLKLHQMFKDEYDRRIDQYVMDGTFDPISWYKRDFFYE